MEPPQDADDAGPAPVSTRSCCRCPRTRPSPIVAGMAYWAIIDACILEVGGGVGEIGIELARRGAASVTTGSFDVSTLSTTAWAWNAMWW